MAQRFDVSRNDITLAGERWPGGRQTVVLLHEGAADVDARHRLAEIKVPVTVACGDLDVPSLVDLCRELADRLPAARHRVLAGMAHQPYLESASTVTELIRSAVAGG